MKREVTPVHGNESSENYLETILVLSRRLPVVRSVDVATELNFKKPSVSVAMKKLRESGHITVSHEGYITLTESGKKIAECIYERHTLLSTWLERLGVDPEIAAEDACRIEHINFKLMLLILSKIRSVQAHFSVLQPIF